MPRLKSALAIMMCSFGLSALAHGVSRAATGATSGPDTLLVLSTTDLIGKTSPCGCHTPKGGLARMATFADSLRRRQANVLWVDAGNFFPEDQLHEGHAWFLVSSFRTLKLDAVGVGDHDLRFGLEPLRVRARAAGVPILCANLMLKRTHRPAFAPSIVKHVGRATVGIFGVMTDTGDLGPARDSLEVTDPTAAAESAIADLKRRGATVIIMLSQLGKVGAEDLAAAVDGIDLGVVGREPPLIAAGRMVRSTLLIYGGQQGQFIGVTRLPLDGTGHAKSAVSEMAMLGPDVPTEPEMGQRVQAFEDAFNETMRKAEKERAASLGTDADRFQPDRFVGNEVCARCHQAQARQWNGTPHARAWRTLVEKKKDATPDCVPCHVVGFGKPGGFVTADVTPRMINVGCENCHGMGTDHDSGIGAAAHANVPESTCRRCHDATSSPEFDFAQFRPYVDHSHAFGDLPPLKAASPMKSM